MKLLLKKNQIAIISVSICLIAFGYLNYTARYQDELELASADVVAAERGENYGEAELVNSEPVKETIAPTEKPTYYFENSKLEREKMYSQTTETYQKMLESSNVTGEQKAIATNEIAKINAQKNSIMICENLILTKGFENVVIFVNEEQISVIIKAEKLQPEQVAQIQNIISREMKAKIENIHITSKML
jgi:stage III sporulation protein AH